MIIFFPFLLAVTLVVLYSLWYGITPMPSSKKAKKYLEQILPPLSGCRVLELGSGWGTLAFLLANRYPDCEVVAYEISPVPCFFTRIWKKFLKQENLEIHWQDFFQTSLDEASLIVCYLYPGAMACLKEKFEKELKPGTIVVSNTFAIPDWEPLEVHELNDLYRTKVYLYKR